MNMQSRRRRTADQLNLFVPRPTAPKWTNLPKDIRSKVENKLAKLILQRVKRLSNGKESNDER